MREPVVSPEVIESLHRRLKQCQSIAELSSGDHEEPGTLAHAIADLADASREYLELLPRLLDDRLAGDELVEALFDLTFVLQHMRYHIEDSRYVRQYMPPLPPDRSD
ncbi:MAG TPA: hypothetical protein VII89_04125 [Candidatus Dormibacteraeota bacterium]